MGVAEYGWMASLNCVDTEEIIFEDYLHCCNRLSDMFRNDYMCDLVIALTHMRVPNDERLTKEALGVDLVLGGHDHIYKAELLNKTLMLKSGTDFKNYSEIDIVYNPDAEAKLNEADYEPLDLDDKNVVTDKPYKFCMKDKFEVTLYKRDITRDIEPMPSLVEVVDFYGEKMKEAMKRVKY